jgi:hypothetical protein
MACLTLWLQKGCRGEDHTRGTSLQTENSRSFRKALNSEVTGFQEKIVSLEAQEKRREEKKVESMKRVYEVWGAQSKLEVWTTESSRFIGRKWGRKIEEQRCSYSSNLMQSIVAY